jgi:hypothetical protein
VGGVYGCIPVLAYAHCCCWFAAVPGEVWRLRRTVQSSWGARLTVGVRSLLGVFPVHRLSRPVWGRPCCQASGHVQLVAASCLWSVSSFCCMALGSCRCWCWSGLCMCACGSDVLSSRGLVKLCRDGFMSCQGVDNECVLTGEGALPASKASLFCLV